MLLASDTNPNTTIRRKKYRALAVALSLLVPSIASADCNGLNVDFNALAELADLTCTVTPDGEGWVADTCDVWQDIRESDVPTSIFGVWNILVNGGSSTIGPRPLRPNTTTTGRLLQPGSRVFILSAVADNEIIIDLNYERGKAGVELDVCTVNPDGERELIATFSDLDEDQDGLNETVTLDHGAAIIFKLVPRGGGFGMNAYEYNLNVSLNNINIPVTTVEEGVDRPGGDYEDFPIGVLPKKTKSGTAAVPSLKPLSSRRICRKACVDDARCMAWTFVKGDESTRPHCWLKDRVPAPTTDSCCDSGIRQRQ